MGEFFCFVFFRGALEFLRDFLQFFQRRFDLGHRFLSEDFFWGFFGGEGDSLFFHFGEGILNFFSGGRNSFSFGEEGRMGEKFLSREFWYYRNISAIGSIALDTSLCLGYSDCRRVLWQLLSYV